MLFYEDLEAYIHNEREKLERLKQADIPEVGIILEVFGPNDNQDVKTNPGGHSVTQAVESLAIDCHGIVGDRHLGLTRQSTPREAPLYHRSRAEIVNRRQLFAVSPYECALLSERLDVQVTPQLLGANLLIGREDGRDYCISNLPVNTYLAIGLAAARIVGRMETSAPPEGDVYFAGLADQVRARADGAAAIRRPRRSRFCARDRISP